MKTALKYRQTLKKTNKTRFSCVKKALRVMCAIRPVLNIFPNDFLILRVLARADQTARLLLYGKCLPFRTWRYKNPAFSSVILGYGNLVRQGSTAIFLCDSNWMDNMIFDEFRKNHMKISPIAWENEQYIRISFIFYMKARQCYVCRVGNIEYFWKRVFVSFDTHQGRTFCRLGSVRGWLSNAGQHVLCFKKAI